MYSIYFGGRSLLLRRVILPVDVERMRILNRDGKLYMCSWRFWVVIPYIRWFGFEYQYFLCPFRLPTIGAQFRELY